MQKKAAREKPDSPADHLGPPPPPLAVTPHFPGNRSAQRATGAVLSLPIRRRPSKRGAPLSKCQDIISDGSNCITLRRPDRCGQTGWLCPPACTTMGVSGRQTKLCTPFPEAFSPTEPLFSSDSSLNVLLHSTFSR